MEKDFKTYYVLATKDNGTKSVYYYTGKEAFHGGDLLSNVLEAKRFGSQAEVLQFLTTHTGIWSLGVSIVGIAGVTFDAIADNDELFRKYSKLEYAIV